MPRKKDGDQGLRVLEGGKKEPRRRHARRDAKGRVRGTPGGHGKGRPKINWDEAFAYFCELEPQERSYGRVAERFEVSDSAVRKHAAPERWEERARELDKRALSRALAKLETNRTNRITSILVTAQKVAVEVLRQVESGVLRPTIPDLVAIGRLAELVEGEPTERLDALLYADVARTPEDELEAELGALREVDETIFVQRRRRWRVSRGADELEEAFDLPASEVLAEEGGLDAAPAGAYPSSADAAAAEEGPPSHLSPGEGGPDLRRGR